jgi:serine/threonine-protein phosphatase 2A regulatory subunit B'
MRLDYTEENIQTAEKEDRLRILEELCSMASDNPKVVKIIVPNLKVIMTMIRCNIFRPLPIIKKAGPSEDTFGLEEDIQQDPSWIHLQPVYEFFLQLIVSDSVDVRSLKGFIDPDFIQEFLLLFDSEEITEREYLKNILHRLYAKLVPRRKLIRKAITDTFNSLIHQRVKFNGTPELLDIFASIISGFAVPLRTEHVVFFEGVIIPLHKVQTCQRFHNELLRCSMLFVSKDQALAQNLIKGLLKYWPYASFAKETLYLSELLEVLDVCDLARLKEWEIIEPLFRRLTECIASQHLGVSDRAMTYFENDFFLQIVKKYQNIIFPIMVHVIDKLSIIHWHKLLKES